MVQDATTILRASLNHVQSSHILQVIACRHRAPQSDQCPPAHRQYSTARARAQHPCSAPTLRCPAPASLLWPPRVITCAPQSGAHAWLFTCCLVHVQPPLHHCKTASLSTPCGQATRSASLLRSLLSSLLRSLLHSHAPLQCARISKGTCQG